jgi:tetratricopeptide (TPR) repeat protein
MASTDSASPTPSTSTHSAATLETTPTALRWPVATDVERFRRLLAGGEHAAAADCCAGPLLAGFSVYDVGAFDAWLELEREHVHAAFHEAVVRSARADLDGGRFDDASTRLKRLLDHDPLAEDVLQPYVRALALAGRRDAALSAYERFADRLREELGLDPLETTVALVQELRRPGPLTTPAAPDAPPSVPEHTLTPPRLVGRAVEVEALRTSTTPIALVAGEPGVGKSRLLREAVSGSLWAAAVEGLDGVPYHPLAAVVRRHPELATGLGPYREDLARLVPEVASDLVPAPPDPETGKGRLTEALARVVDAAGGRLVIDDLQWADAATLEMVAYLAERGTRVFGAFRASEVGPGLQRALDAWRARGALTLLALEPLDEAGVRALLADLTGRPRGPELFSRWLWDRSGGNAMFALEALRDLFEAGVLRAGPDGWETDIDDLTSDYGELDVPPAVAQVIRRRLGFLSAPTIRLLEAAAVLRQGFDARLLAGITGLSPLAAADALAEAVRAGFVGDDTFRHDLLRQAIYDDVPRERRRLMHALVAEALEGADPGLLAEHWFAAGDTGRARGAWCEQATRLRHRGLQHDAIGTLERALERCPDPIDQAWLRLSLADAQRELSRIDEADAALARVLATHHHEPRLHLATALARASLLLVQGRLSDANEVLQRSEPLIATVDDGEARLDHVMLRARVAKQSVRPDQAIALLQPEIARLRRGARSLRLCQFLTSLGTLHDDAGRHDEALRLHREAFDLAKALGARYHQVDIAINLVYCYGDLRRYREAEAVGSEALALGAYDNVPLLRNNLASLAFESGRVAEALTHYEQLQQEHGQPFLRAIALARSAEANAVLGNRDPIPALLDEALAMLALTDYPVVVGRVAIAVLRLGDEVQVERLRSQAPGLVAEALPPHQRAEFSALWRSRVGVTQA